MLSTITKKYTCLALCVLLLFTSSACQGKNNKKISESGFYLDTVVTITLYSTTKKSLIQDCFDICDKYEKMFSATLPESEIYKLNSRQTNCVSDETAQLIEKGLYYSALSNGVFDITVGTLTDLWDFKSEEHNIPSDDKIEEALKHVGYEKVKVENNTVTFSDDETKIDLGAIAKGYIADRIKDYLVSKNVQGAIINLGGNVLCVGEKPDGGKYNIGIQYPFKEQNETIATAAIGDTSIVSSGTYQRYFYIGGTLYHHILDVSTGYPVRNNLTDVTIFSNESVDGDALSTICFLLGEEKGMELINSIDGVYAVFIDNSYNIKASDGLENVCDFKTNQ